MLLEERANRHRGRVAAARAGERVEKERLLIDVRGMRDVDRTVHEVEHVAGRAADDARVDGQAVTLRFAERDEHPSGHVRVGLAERVVAPGPAAVGTLPADETGEVRRDAAVAIACDTRALLGAAHGEGRDEPARYVLGALVDRRCERRELVSHRAGERGLHGHGKRAVRGVGEVREVDRLELAVLRDDPAGRGRLRRHVDEDRQLLLDRIGQVAWPGRCERELRGSLGLDLRGPAHDDRFARVDRHALRERAGHRHAFGFERHVDRGVALRRVAHERAQLDGVADAKHAWQRRPQKERLGREKLVRALAHHRVPADRARLHAPRR